MEAFARFYNNSFGTKDNKGTNLVSNTEQIVNEKWISRIWAIFLNRFFLREAVFLFAGKTVFKILVFLFTILVAKHFSEEEFGDFQFVCSIINVLSQPTVIISLIIARIGCSFQDGSRPNNLRFFLNKNRKWLLFLIIVVPIIFWLFDSSLANIAKVGARGSFVFAGILISCTFVLNFLIGILQSLEKFYAIGFLFLLLGVLNIILGFFMVNFGLGIVYAYVVQAFAVITALLSAYLIIHRMLPGAGLEIGVNTFSVPHFSYLAMISVGIFFFLYNMDIIASKMFFDRADAGYYARLALIGKISFLLASSLALVIFPKVSKAYEAGSNPTPYLVKGTISFIILSIICFVAIISTAKGGAGYIFGNDFEINMTILILIVISGICQSYIYILINYGTAIINYGILGIMGCVMIFQGIFFLKYHDSLFQIAIDVLIPSILGACFLLIYTLKKSMIITVKHGKERYQPLSNNPNI